MAPHPSIRAPNTTCGYGNPQVPAHCVRRLRTTAKAPAASPTTPTTSPATPSPRAVESLAEAFGALGATAEVFDAVSDVVPAAVSLRTGAGFSGSSSPLAASSIQRETWPPEEGWGVWKVSCAVSSGSWPKATSKSSYWRGPIFPPVQVIWETASVIVPSSVLTGVLSLVSVTFAVHPSCGETSTPSNGWSVGRNSWTFVVLAVSLSS